MNGTCLHDSRKTQTIDGHRTLFKNGCERPGILPDLRLYCTDEIVHPGTPILSFEGALWLAEHHVSYEIYCGL